MSCVGVERSWPVVHLFVVMHTLWVCVHVCAYVSLRQRDGTERTTEAELLGEALMHLQWDLLALKQGQVGPHMGHLVNNEPWNPCLVTQHNKCILVTGPLVTLEVPEDHSDGGRRIWGLDSEDVGSNCPALSSEVHGHPTGHPGSPRLCGGHLGEG